MAEKKEKTAQLIKTHRLAKGYTQLQLAELTRVSLRSIQRIESGQVAPRLYTLQVLAGQLGFELEKVAEATTMSDMPAKNNVAKKIILTISVAIMLILFAAAFVSQSSKFPETNFEYFVFWGMITACYMAFLLKLWK